MEHRSHPGRTSAATHGRARRTADPAPRDASRSLRAGAVPPALPASLALALVLLAAIVLHRNGLRLPFFADDYLFLEQARHRPVLAALATPDAIGNFFRPVGRQLYFWLVGHLSGESPDAFHAVNLALFLGIITLLFAIVRRLAGDLAAAVAAGFLALHYAADVPLRWASGSQDLLAVLGALAAIALHLGGRRWWGSPMLLLALLSKETVLLTPIIAAALDRRPGEAWRSPLVRAWPLGLAVVGWGGLWLITLPQRHALGASLGFEPSGVAAVCAHLVHVAIGLEWRGAFEGVGRPSPPWLPLLAVGLAVLGARGGRGKRAPDREAGMVGVLWALAAAAPVVAVAAMWSAYYYLFALCGVALVLGTLAASRPRWVAVAIVAILAAGSQSGRSSPEFATGRGAWTWQSHINRRYIDRATERVARYLADLTRQRPTVEPRTTFFFAGVPAFLAWQSADGPLVRWVYRDTSLRSYYQSDFTLARARRGPALFFAVADDTLHEEAREPSQLWAIALRVLLNDRQEAARDLLALLAERESPAADVLYFLAWLEWDRGDTLAAKGLLERAGITPRRGPSLNVGRAAAAIVAGDTAGGTALLGRAVRDDGLDARAHALLADTWLRRQPADPLARIEALAARALAPDDGTAWMRWGLIQAFDGRHGQAIRSLERALDLGIGDPARSAQVREVLAQLHRMTPGGALAQRAVHRDGGETVEDSAAPQRTGGRSP